MYLQKVPKTAFIRNLWIPKNPRLQKTQTVQVLTAVKTAKVTVRTWQAAQRVLKVPARRIPAVQKKVAPFLMEAVKTAVRQPQIHRPVTTRTALAQAHPTVRILQTQKVQTAIPPQRKIMIPENQRSRLRSSRNQKNRKQKKRNQRNRNQKNRKQRSRPQKKP